MTDIEHERLFSWQTWTPNTSFLLCNVPWDMSYRDIVRFEDEEAQTKFFEGIEHTSDVKKVEGASMARFGVPVRLRIPFNTASKYNYMVAYNNYPGIEVPRHWYYFIQTVRYINAFTTEFTIMLDVWQSFQFNVEFGRCYVERGHIGIANENQEENHGRDYLAIPEGLDTGSEMAVTSQKWKSLFGLTEQGAPPLPDYGVLVVSNTDLTAEGGSVNDPKLNTAPGSFFESLPNGCQFAYFDSWLNYKAFMTRVADKPWVSQGISAIYVCPKLDKARLGDPVDFQGTKGYLPQGGWRSRTWNFMRINGFRDLFRIPVRYRFLKKFRTFPYAAVEMTCLNGQSLILKPEEVDSDNLDIMEIYGLALPNARIKFYPKSYNSVGANGIEKPVDGDALYGNGAPIDGGEYISSACGIDNLPQMTIVNNMAVSVIASQAHSLAWQNQSAGWEQNKTMMGVNNAYRQANMSNSYASQQTNLANSNRTSSNQITANSLQNANTIAAQQQSTDIGLQQVSTGLNGALGAGSQALGGNFAGAAGAAVGTGASLVMNAVANTQRTQTREGNLANTLATNSAQVAQANSFNTDSTNLSNQRNFEFADMNRALGTAVAQGDYANTVAGINARVQDMALTQPSNSGAMGGDAFNLSNGNFGLLVRFRQLPPAEMRNVGEFWLRYGYYVQRFVKPPESLKVMTKFTYWKMHELYISSSTCPEEYRLTIKGIFEKGVTVWDKPEYIGNTDYADNEPLKGVSY